MNAPAKIPASSFWCSYCVAPEAYGTESPCPAHRGPNGERVPYAGPDVYEPSDWVLECIGKIFDGPDGVGYVCFGYDPRHGFWMRRSVGIPLHMTNVSERAIGRTYHKRLDQQDWP